MVLKEADGALTLETHVARGNPHWSAVAAAPVASLAVFQGPQAYVSPSWYETKREHGRVVPTWNYIAVHARGALEVVTDAAWLHAHLDELVAINEARHDHAWALSDAPADYVDGLARGVVGLRLHVERLQGSWKMIQHRSEGDRRGTMAGLTASPREGDRAVAAVMAALERARG